MPVCNVRSDRARHSGFNVRAGQRIRQLTYFVIILSMPSNGLVDYTSEIAWEAAKAVPPFAVERDSNRVPQS